MLQKIVYISPKGLRGQKCGLSCVPGGSQCKRTKHASAQDREAFEVEVQRQGEEEADEDEGGDEGLKPLELLALEVGQHDDAWEEAHSEAAGRGEPVGVGRRWPRPE